MFAWTNLDRLLQTMGIENLVFCGTSTNGCVESAVKDAADLGYRNLLVSDACAAGSEEGHEAALARLDGGPNVVVSTAEMTARLAELGLEPVPARREALAKHLASPPPAPADGGGPSDPYKLIFGEPPRPSLDPRTTALMLMDVQRLDGRPRREPLAAGGRARRRGAACAVLRAGGRDPSDRSPSCWRSAGGPASR